MRKPAPENPSTRSGATIVKRVRTTDYIVSIHYSDIGREDVKDKILRLIKNDIANGQ